MKSQFSTQLGILSDPSQINDQRLNKISQLTCINKSKAHYVCTNSICMLENAVICSDRKCTCRALHQYCIRTDIESIVMAIQSRASPLKEFQQKINDMFEAAIDRLSAIRQKIIEKNRQLFQSKTYTNQQNMFFQILQSKLYQNLTGQLLSQITTKINGPNKINQQLLLLKEQLKNISQKMMISVNTYGSQVERSLLKLRSELQYLPNIKLNLKQFRMFRDSKIINKIEEEVRLLNFYPTNISSVKLLYRASDNDFSAENFHKLCQDIPSIMVLIKTSHQKVIGGYTPLAFPSNSRGSYLDDPSLKSFLFSVTQGDELPLRSLGSAIMNESEKEYVLRFGGGSDLRISNQANSNQKSYVSLCSYSTEKYKSTQGSTKLTGSDTINFTISEWQVWNIILGQQNQKYH